MPNYTPTPESPLTYAQESLYFLEQLTNGEPVYNMPQAFRLRGLLNEGALEQALQWVVQRHDGLRMTVAERKEGPRQVTGQAVPALRRHAMQNQPGFLHEQLQAAVREPFNLQHGPIFRADLFQLAPEENVLLLNLHHIAGDMSSLGIIFSDLSRAYAALTSGGLPLTEGEPIPLSTYATERRSKELSAETLAFWRQNLKDSTAELELPIDRFRPRYPSFRGSAYYFDLDATNRAALAEFARKNRSSLYMVCLAALETLLHRYSGQERFAIATPFTDRDDPRLDQTVGYLINLLPIACEVRPQQTFRDLLAQVRAQCLQVYGHHEISFRRIVQELGISSDNPKPPLARVVFQHFPEIASLQLAGVECEPIRVHSGTSKFDLCVSMAEHAGAITTEIEYDSDIYDERTIRRIARLFRNLLTAVVSHPDDAVGDLRLSDAEEERTLEQWSAPVADYPRDRTVHALFEEQVARNPSKVALRFDQGELSYRDLDRRASTIAGRLRKAGVKPGDFVGVCLERSPELIATLIGILKAGAAFVPFEAAYPKARLDYLFSDSGVRVLLTNSRHAHIAPSGTELLLLDNQSEEIEPIPAVGACDSVAYMMYTSGSTGNPKGAMIPHRAIVRLVKNNDFAAFGPDEVFLAFAPVSFDASTLEIWGALLNGATLAIYPPNFDSVEQFEEVLRQHKVTTLWLTAGLFNTIVDRNVEALRGVRQLLVGGDVLSVAHIQKALAALPETQLINGYGPTENTTFTCCYRIPSDLPSDRSIPIGKPIRNTSVYLLDERLQKVPIGVAGDLYTGGDGLSLGYWRKPDLTLKSFIANPFVKGGQLYKTGDRARFLEDGNIEFLGRRDSQVKIRGFRIEIEEVEGAFRKLPSVQDVAVVPHSDAGGNKSLAGYVVLKTGASLSAAELQSQAGSHLPAHACPSRIVFLQELPLGPNGKVNRSALPKPSDLAAGAEAELVPPTNEVEAKLVQLWRQILEIPALSIDDNFFHLGGESLRATRAVSQMNAAFNCRLTLPRLFEAPTVRKMARLVESSQRDAEMPMKRRTPAVSNSVPDVSRLSEQDVDALLSQLLAADDSAQK